MLYFSSRLSPYETNLQREQARTSKAQGKPLEMFYGLDRVLPASPDLLGTGKGVVVKCCQNPWHWSPSDY